MYVRGGKGILQGTRRDPELAGDGLVAIDDLGALREIPTIQHGILVLSRPFSTSKSIVDLDNQHLDTEAIKRWVNMILDLQVLEFRLHGDIPCQHRDRIQFLTLAGSTITDEFDKELCLVGDIVVLNGLVLTPVNILVGEESESGSGVVQELGGAGGDFPFKSVRRSAVHFLVDAEGVFQFDGVDGVGKFLAEEVVIIVVVVVGCCLVGGVIGVVVREVVNMMVASVGLGWWWWSICPCAICRRCISSCCCCCCDPMVFPSGRGCFGG